MSEVTTEFKEMAEFVKQHLLDNIAANLVKLRNDERAERTYTVREVIDVILNNALPKWREPWTNEEWHS